MLVTQMHLSIRKSDLCLCEQLRHRSACASTHTSQHFVILYIDKIILLISVSEFSRLEMAHSSGELRVSFYYGVFCAFVFNIPPTTRVIRRRGHSLQSGNSQKFFIPSSISLWNSLADDLKDSYSLPTF